MNLQTTPKSSVRANLADQLQGLVNSGSMKTVIPTLISANDAQKPVLGEEAFVRVYKDPKTTHLNFSGLLAPGADKQGELRNRFLISDKRAKEWFVPFCEELIASEEARDFLIRVKLVGAAGGTLGFVRPCANDAKHARQEWEGYKKYLADLPQKVEDCQTPEQTEEFVVRHLARELKLTYLSRSSKNRKGPYLLNNSGVIYRVAKAAEVFGYLGRIASGQTTLTRVLKENNIWTERATWL